MSDKETKREESFVDELKIKGKWILALVIDTVFLVAWVLLQALLKYIQDRMPILGIDGYAFHIVQLTLTFSTTFFVILWFLRDLYRMFLRTALYMRQDKDFYDHGIKRLNETAFVMHDTKTDTKVLVENNERVSEGGN